MKKNQVILIIGITAILTYSLTWFWIERTPLENNSHLQSQNEDNHETAPDHDEEVASVRLSPEELTELKIKLESAGPGMLTIHRDLAGEVVTDPDRVAHIGPRFPGIVKEVKKKLGDYVVQGEVLAIIESNESMTPYEIQSLIDGTIIEMHLTEGEMISGDNDHAFLVADLSEVWVNFSIYQKDLPYIHLGQKVEIAFNPETAPSTGTISYISPVLDEHTRTATARVVMNNSNGVWRPGMFVTGTVETAAEEVDILIPKSALEMYQNKQVVFVKTSDIFIPQPVHLGRSSRDYVEILNGIEPGQIFVAKNGFSLKAELEKDSFSGGHAH